MSINTKNIEAIDLFCGAGGLTHGLEKSGISVNLGIDINPACEYPYVANNNSKFLLKSVVDLTSDELSQYFSANSYKLLAGCAPCQTFSKYNQKASDKDKRWWLLLQFSRLVREQLPDFVTMENVPGLESQNVFHKFVQALTDNGYRVSYQVINCSLYGVPQQRNRLVLLASKHGEIRLLSPKEFGRKQQTVRDAIYHLPRLRDGESDQHDRLHKCSVLSETNLKRIKASKPGGSWRDWSDDLVAECHKKTSGCTYSGVYGRMEWDMPAPTITTQFFGYGNGRFGHPEQNRALSLREGAILQSFPKKYKFAPDTDRINQTVIGKLIGNAVPVKIGVLIGQSIISHMNSLPIGGKNV